MYASNTIDTLIEVSGREQLHYFNVCNGASFEPLQAIRSQRQVIDASLPGPGLWNGSIRREYRRNKTYPEVNDGLATAFNKGVTGTDELAKLPAELRLMQIHKWITGNDAFRKQGVRIGPFNDFPCACDLSRLIPEMFRKQESSNTDSAEIAASLHLDILMIHPFPDGNGRTARLLASCCLLQAGYKSTLFTSVEQHFAYNPVQYTRILQALRNKTITREAVIRFFLTSMMISSWYAAWFRQRQMKIITALEDMGLAKTEAVKLLTEIDTGAENPGSRNFDPSFASTFIPWHQLREKFSPLELQLLSSQLQRLRQEQGI